MIISRQSQNLYKTLLQANTPLSAKNLANKLHVYPNTIYRLSEPLINIGLIDKNQRYPYLFTAKPLDEGLSLFLLQQNDWFSKQFAASNNNNCSLETNKIPESQQIRLSFVQSRDELMNLSVEEINQSDKAVDLLRSGHEIPADVMLALINAKKRGVLTRMLIQDYSRENAEQVSYWKKNGILVKKTTLRHVRLMIYDSTVVYFMSYKHSDSEKDIGVKISYPPLATILSQLFEQWWQKAEKIS